MANQSGVWIEHVGNFPGDIGIMDAFELAFIATGADPSVALYARHTEDYDRHIYLMSPAAFQAFGQLGGVEWKPALDYQDYQWTPMVINRQASRGPTANPNDAG